MKKIIALLLFSQSIIFCHAQNAPIPDSLYPPSDLTISYHSEWTKKHYPERIKEFKENPLNYGDIVFLGNSITEQGKNWDERFKVPSVKNRGISGDVTEGVLKRLSEIYYFKPKAVFILIGINDLSLGKSPEFVSDNILEIVETIHKNSKSTKIYVQTILPTKNSSLVEKIQTVNTILKKTESSSHFKLIDIHKLFMDKDDYMKNEYTVDGVHLNDEGYRLWTDKIKKQVLSASKTKTDI